MIILGGGDVDQYEVPRSLRFNNDDSPGLSYTPGASASVLTKGTWSTWLRRGSLASGLQYIFAAGPSAAALDALRFASGADTLNFYLANQAAANLSWAAKLRDCTDWYHVVLTVDTTLSTAADRVIITVNGVQLAAPSGTPPAQNYAFTRFNVGATPQYIGTDGASNAFDGYIAEAYWIADQALPASAFGAADSDGRWQPKAFAGTFGTSDSYLDFSDNSNTTAATLGADRSGNGRNFTPSNFSVASGVGNDSLSESPTDYVDASGLEHGCFATLDPGVPNSAQAVTLSNGGLTATTVVSNAASAVSTLSFDAATDHVYFEATIDAGGGGTADIVGLVDAQGNHSSVPDYPGSTATGYGYYYTGVKYNSGSSSAYGASFTTGDVVGCEVNAGTVTFYKKVAGVMTSQGVAFTGVTGRKRFAVTPQGGRVSVNFGQRALESLPSGAKTLRKGNLGTEAGSTGGSFTGNGNANGPKLDLLGAPSALSLNGNAVTLGTQAHGTSDGAKIDVSSSTYNASGANTYTATIASVRKVARAQVT